VDGCAGSINEEASHGGSEPHYLEVSLFDVPRPQDEGQPASKGGWQFRGDGQVGGFVGSVERRVELDRHAQVQIGLNVPEIDLLEPHRR